MHRWYICETSIETTWDMESYLGKFGRYWCSYCFCILFICSYNISNYFAMYPFNTEKWFNTSFKKWMYSATASILHSCLFSTAYQYWSLDLPLRELLIGRPQSTGLCYPLPWPQANTVITVSSMVRRSRNVILKYLIWGTHCCIWCDA